MKKFTPLCFLLIVSILPYKIFSQLNDKLLFDNSWYGFATGVYGSGQSPSAVKSADLDNDGDSDIVVSQENFSNGFVVLKNQGSFIFSAPVKYNSTKASKDIVVADFNNDGKKDVALTNSGTNFDGKTILFILTRAGEYLEVQ